ncbi:MAG: hypothetical protein LBQ83_00745, partial [Candidatus Margulisbacteria bacterium]|nr:hypothetical protein [Candidatus Margulisiibacteriota bacterium]
MHKFYFLLLCCALASAGVWQDFNGNYEVYIPPGYPPVIFEQVTSNVPLDGQALKATASSENGAALFIIEGLSNPEEVDTLTFFCRTDTGGDVQIALADSRRITAFESINDYLPENAVSRGWQKAVYPLTTKDINIHDIRKIYVQLIPQEGTGATL